MMNSKVITGLVLTLFLVGMYMTPVKAGIIPPTDYLSGFDSQKCAIGDFNSDGRDDVAVSNYHQPNVMVFIQNPLGTLDSPITYPMKYRPIGLAAGDISGDGRDDIVATGYLLGSMIVNYIAVFIQNLNGTLDGPVYYLTGSGPVDVAIGDLNSDGRNDVAVANYDDDHVSVCFQNDNGLLYPEVVYDVGLAPYDVAIGDINNDNRDDMVVLVTDYGHVDVFFFIQNESGQLDTPEIHHLAGEEGPGGLESVAIGDVNSDDRNDVVMLWKGNRQIVVFLQRTDGTLEEPIFYPTTDSDIRELDIGDLNIDGKNDIVVASYSEQRVSVYLQSLHGNLTTPVSFSSSEELHHYANDVKIGDLNNDDINDIVVVNRVPDEGVAPSTIRVFTPTFPIPEFPSVLILQLLLIITLLVAVSRKTLFSWKQISKDYSKHLLVSTEDV